MELSKLAVRLLSIIGAATSADAYAPGQERAPGLSAT
jgi:hypothetical protein